MVKKSSIVIAVLLILVLAMAGLLLNDYITLGNPNGSETETETTEAETTEDTTSPLTTTTNPLTKATAATTTNPPTTTTAATTTTSPPTTTTEATLDDWWDPSFSTTPTYTFLTFAEETVVTWPIIWDSTD